MAVLIIKRDGTQILKTSKTSREGHRVMDREGAEELAKSLSHKIEGVIDEREGDTKPPKATK